jgi:O-antigen ligase
VSRELAPRLVVAAGGLAIAASVFVLAAADGGYGLTSRTVVTVTVWGLLILSVGFGVARLPDRPARICCLMFAGFAGWTLLSAAWAASIELAVLEFDRVALYLGVLLLAIIAIPRRQLADGLFLGVVAIAVVSLTTRFFPHVIGARLTSLQAARTRLSYPVGYWNGLGILVSLAVPLALRGGTIQHRGPVSRGAAVSALPIIACVVYLTSSRGAALTAAAGIATFLLASARRWQALSALVAGSVGSAVMLAALIRHHTLIDGPLVSELAIRQGRVMALILVGCAALSAVLYIAADRLFASWSAPPTAVGRALVALTLVALGVLLVLSHPVKRFHDFKRPIPTTQAGTGAHLLSGNGSGRWQFWSSAVDEFRTAPIAGRGAGSFPAWWAKHASFTYFVQNAHSLYLEVLGDLGIVGLALLLGSFGAGFVGCVMALRSTGGDLRVTIAAGCAVFVSFLVGAAIDWIWQLPAVGMVGIAGLGVALRAPVRAEQKPSRLGVGVAVIAIGWAILIVAGVSWLTAQRISDSQAAVRHGDAAAARRSALDGKSLEPWAASPYVQLALVAELEGRFGEARRWIQGAIQRDPEDWRSWYLAARIERESGLPVEAARSYAQARSLNPRSPVFASTAR